MIRTAVNSSITVWKGVSAEKSEPEKNVFAHRISFKDGQNGLRTISQKVIYFFRHSSCLTDMLYLMYI